MNKSLCNGISPDKLKSARVTPLDGTYLETIDQFLFDPQNQNCLIISFNPYIIPSMNTDCYLTVNMASENTIQRYQLSWNSQIGMNIK